MRRKIKSMDPGTYRGLGYGRTTLTKKEWDMVVENKGLVMHAFEKAKIPYDEWDDLYADIGLPVLMRCAKVYDPTRGRFSTLVVLSAYRAAKEFRHKFAKKYMSQINTGLLDIVYNSDRLGLIPVTGMVADAERVHIIHNALCHLNPNARKMIIDRFYKGKTYRQIGKDCGHSAPWAKMKLDYNLSKIATLLASKGLS